MGSEDGGTVGPGAIPYISIAQMTTEIRDMIAGQDYLDYLWSDDWSPEFYRAQARLGFIAVARRRPEANDSVLLPQLQHAYAVLDWPDLTPDRGVRRILENGRMDREDVRLVIDDDPGRVLTELDESWGQRSWLVAEYAGLMKQLASTQEQAADPRFRLVATVLVSGDEAVSGELGYAIGKVYTSLTGFFRRERPEWNNFGKLQMVLLARRLEAAGFAFWNLGHPFMDYKTRLGAQVVARSEFLDRWDPAVNADLPEPGW
jgi:hypothetical protein